jgi:hypothetical protein
MAPENPFALLASRVARRLRCGRHRWFQTKFVAIALVVATLGPPPAHAQGDPHALPDAQFAITDDAIWTFFVEHGGADTFGEPISRQFVWPGVSSAAQLFQRTALQVQPDGSVQVLPLATLLPYTGFAGLTVPAVDPAIAFLTPAANQPNYSARLRVFLKTVVPEPFWSSFNDGGGAVVWGLPTSPPSVDPNNSHFAYQRFQNGVLMNNANAGTTQALPLGQYLKNVLTNKDVPPDLAREMAESPLLRQFVGSEAFQPDLGS